MFCSPTALPTILLALTALVRPASSSAKERELIEVEVSPEHNFSNLLTMIFPYEITEASVKDFEGIANVVKKSFNELQLDSDLCDIHDRIITQVVPLRVGSLPLNSSDDGIPLWLRDAVLPRTEDLGGNNNHHHRLRNLRRKLVVGELKPHWYYDLPQEDRTGVLNGAEFIETVFLLRGTCQNCVPLNTLFFTKPSSVSDDRRALGKLSRRRHVGGRALGRLRKRHDVGRALARYRSRHDDDEEDCEDRSPFLNSEFVPLANDYLRFMSLYGPIMEAREINNVLNDPAASRTLEFCNQCSSTEQSCSYSLDCHFALCVDNHEGCFEDDHCDGDCVECNCQTGLCEEIEGCCTRNSDCHSDDDEYCFTGDGCLEDSLKNTCVKCRSDDDCDEDECLECDCDTGECKLIEDCCYRDKDCDDKDEICSLEDKDHCSYHTCIEDDDDSCQQDDDCYCGDCDCDGTCKTVRDCCENDDDCHRDEICYTGDSSSDVYHECIKPCSSGDCDEDTQYCDEVCKDCTVDACLDGLCNLDPPCCKDSGDCGDCEECTDNGRCKYRCSDAQVCKDGNECVECIDNADCNEPGKICGPDNTCIIESTILDCVPACNDCEECNDQTGNCDYRSGCCSDDYPCAVGLDCDIDSTCKSHSRPLDCVPACKDCEVCNDLTGKCDYQPRCCSGDYPCPDGMYCDNDSTCKREWMKACKYCEEYNHYTDTCDYQPGCCSDDYPCQGDKSCIDEVCIDKLQANEAPKTCDEIECDGGKRCVVEKDGAICVENETESIEVTEPIIESKEEETKESETNTNEKEGAAGDDDGNNNDRDDDDTVGGGDDDDDDEM